MTMMIGICLRRWYGVAFVRKMFLRRFCLLMSLYCLCLCAASNIDAPFDADSRKPVGATSLEKLTVQTAKDIGCVRGIEFYCVKHTSHCHHP
jgi:hypothetical protein